MRLLLVVMKNNVQLPNLRHHLRHLIVQLITHLILNQNLFLQPLDFHLVNPFNLENALVSFGLVLFLQTGFFEFDLIVHFFHFPGYHFAHLFFSCEIERVRVLWFIMIWDVPVIWHIRVFLKRNPFLVGKLLFEKGHLFFNSRDLIAENPTLIDDFANAILQNRQHIRQGLGPLISIEVVLHLAREALALSEVLLASMLVHILLIEWLEQSEFSVVPLEQLCVVIHFNPIVVFIGLRVFRSRAVVLGLRRLRNVHLRSFVFHFNRHFLLFKYLLVIYLHLLI